jgi:putative copper export protein
VFSHAGGYRSPEAFTHGMTIAVYIGGGLVAVGALAAAMIKRRPRADAPEVALDFAA